MKFKKTALIYSTIITMFILDSFIKINLEMNLSYDIILQILITRVPTNDFVKLILHAVAKIIIITGGLIIIKYVIKRKQHLLKVLFKVVLVELGVLLINIILDKLHTSYFITATLSYSSYIAYYSALIYIIFDDRALLITNLLKSKIIYSSIMIGYLIMKMLNSKLYVYLLFRNNNLSLWRAFHQNEALILYQLLNKIIGYILLLLLVLLFNKKLNNKVNC
ncbi:hypothetical protein [Vallitalea sp.]|jgi:hypothetical protein|uniref:hypothetical protein n=1 Tax=Vallitalea sp. TaxID=1882829 RepID=UPI0025DB9841|nr:hypothetical protein [Vallitalea sp.]MCT4687910.1 hypothetical protein [Vallitalea sp.]